MDLVMTKKVRERLDHYMVPPLGSYEPGFTDLVWFVPKEIIKKKTKTGRTYWIVKAIDSTSTITGIKCWAVKDDDKVYLNRPYMARLDYDANWGFSTRSLRYNFKLLG